MTRNQLRKLSDIQLYILARDTELAFPYTFSKSGTNKLFNLISRIRAEQKQREDKQLNHALRNSVKR